MASGRYPVGARLEWDLDTVLDAARIRTGCRKAGCTDLALDRRESLALLNEDAPVRPRGSCKSRRLAETHSIRAFSGK